MIGPRRVWRAADHMRIASVAKAFSGASGDGRRSATVAINQQITATKGEPAAFVRLRHSFAAAVCAALATRG